MSLESSQVVHSLIAFYKRRGVDLAHMLGDPLFDKLPLPDKVEAIKQHAGTILAHGSDNLGRHEKAVIRGDALVGAGLVGMGTFGVANKLFSTGAFPIASARYKALAITGGTAVLGGAVAGALTGYLKTRDLADQKRALRSELHRVSRNPSTENAIGALASSTVHSHTGMGRANLLGKIINKIDSFTADNIVSTVEPKLEAQYHNFSNMKKTS